MSNKFKNLPLDTRGWHAIVEPAKDAYWLARRKGKDETHALLSALDVALADHAELDEPKKNDFSTYAATILKNELSRCVSENGIGQVVLSKSRLTACVMEQATGCVKRQGE